MSITPRFLDDIRSRLTLSEIIGQRIPVTRAGREFKACCPFHKEKTPSFTINDDKHFYHCFGCGAHGDALNFVMQHDNLPFPEAVELLAAQAGLQVPKFSAEDSKKAREEKDLYSLMDEAAKWFEGQLGAAQNRAIMDYVRGRGFSPDTIASFRLGFAPADAQALRGFLTGKGYTDQQMIAVGLVKKGQGSKDPYVFFRERVMVPVMDRRGRVVAFGGRVLPDHMRSPDRGDFTPAKYMNSAETPIFNKGQVLYGAPQARQAAVDGHLLFVTEGYFDVIAAHQAGFRGAVAPMGTALTEEQIMLLWKMIPSDEKVPVLCFDGDTAGRRAAERAMERILPLLGAGRSVRIAFLPDGEDPDSLIKNSGKAAFGKVLDGAIPMIEFLWRHHTAERDFSTPEQRAALVKSLNEAVQKIADAEVQKHYSYLMRQRVSDHFFTSKRQNSGGYQGKPYQGAGRYGGKNAQAGAAITLRSPRLQSKDIQARILLAAVLNHPAIYPDIEEPLALMRLGNDRLDRLRQKLISLLEAQPDIPREVLRDGLIRNGFEQDLEMILSPATYIHGQFSAPSQEDMADLRQKWLALWQGSEKTDLKKEIAAGWKTAFYASSEEEEERIKQMLNEGET